MIDYQQLKEQMHDCTECLKAFLVRTVDRHPELTEHAGIIREPLKRCGASSTCLRAGSGPGAPVPKFALLLSVLRASIGLV